MTILDAIATPQTAIDVLRALYADRYERHHGNQDGLPPLVMEDVRAILDWHVDEGRAGLAGMRDGERVYMAREAAK